MDIWAFLNILSVFFCESIRANRPDSRCESPGHLRCGSFLASWKSKQGLDLPLEQCFVKRLLQIEQGNRTSEHIVMIEWRHLFYRGAPKSSKNKKNILRTSPLVRDFPFKVAASFLEHSLLGAFIQKVPPFMPT